MAGAEFNCRLSAFFTPGEFTAIVNVARKGRVSASHVVRYAMVRLLADCQTATVLVPSDVRAWSGSTPAAALEPTAALKVAIGGPAFDDLPLPPYVEPPPDPEGDARWEESCRQFRRGMIRVVPPVPEPEPTVADRQVAWLLDQPQGATGYRRRAFTG